MTRLAAQLNTVRAYCGTQEELLDTLSRIRELGFDGVELESNLLKNADRQAVAQRLAQLGLQVCSIRSPFARTGYGMEEMIAEAKALSCVHVGVGTLTASYFTMGLPGIEKYLEQAQAVCDRFEKEGLRPLYSLRFHEFMRLSDGAWSFDKLESRSETASYCWETDVLCLTRAAVDPPQVFSRLAGRMPICRLSDQKIRENETYFFYAQREECPLGEGLFDLHAWIRAARQAGAEWFTIGQELCDRDPFACLKASLEKAKEFGCTE
ncbi:MAG: sugar phosphate isomerase/epimerase [Provencibacterium sp.]|nr:sugar phosphate isomerase/epimerase [Provencibacterium sp.]